MEKIFTLILRKIFLISFVFIGLSEISCQAQCLVCPLYDFSINPTGQWQLSSSSIESSGCKIYKVQVQEGYSYTFKTGCEDGADASFDTYIELLDSNCNVITSNDDYCVLLSRIDWVATFSGTAYLKVRGYNSNFGDFTLAYNACGANSLFTYLVTGNNAVFTNASTDTTANYAWYFGDGFNGTGINPTHTYVCPNNIQVNLVVTDTSGCSTTFSQFLSFGSALSANFNFSISNNQYTFTDQSTNNPIAWEWDFGDGTSSSDQNPVHSFVCAGYYDVILTVTNADGCTDTYDDFVYVENGTGDINAGFTYFYQGAVTGFHDVSTGNPTNWQWDFGDGTTSSNQDPSHTYECSGEYFVSLNVSNAAGCENTAYLTINTSGIHTLEARFTLGINGSVVTFNDSTIGTPLSYEWDLDNGVFAYSADTMYDYHCSGFYFVGLTVSDDFCSSSQFAGIDIEGSLQANFTHVSTNNTVSFTSNSEGGGLSYSWDFDDGNTSTLVNPVHSYECPGDYDIYFSIYDSLGCSSSISESINVGGFTADFDYLVNNSSVDFTNTSDSSVTWEWNFGDGISSNIQNPTHVYECPGSYYVSLSVSNGNGCFETFGQQIEITAGFQASFTYTINGTSVDFTNNSNGNSTNWDWSFGDGTYSLAENPNHSYECPGSYYVLFTLDSSGGCTSEIEQLITIEGLNPTFTYSVNNQTVNFELTNSTGLTLYEWDFDDGTFSSLPNPTHTYLSCGNYFVYLTVNNASGCSDYSYQNVIIQGPNHGLAVSSNSPVCLGGDLNLSAGNSLGMEYNWNGPGFYYSSNPSPTISDASPELSGTYIFELTDVNGCPVVDSVTVEVLGEVAVDVTQSSTTLTSTPASSYQWIDCNTGNPVEGANGQIFEPSINGNYSVIITDANGCTGQSNCFSFNSIGFEDFTANSIVVFPNPTSGLAEIRGLYPNSKMKLTDAVGRKIKLTLQANSIDLTDVSPGIYFLSVESIHGSVSIKVVKH